MIDFVTDLETLNNSAEVFTLVKDGNLTKDESNEIVSKIKEALTANAELVALAAPQIGINKQIFCIKFNDVIKTFINPVITKKQGITYSVETIPNIPGKEYFVTRPVEVSAVYYTEDFKYEENKFLDSAAKIFDQQCLILEGILPNQLGMEFPAEEGNSLKEAPAEILEIIAKNYNEWLKIKNEDLQKEILSDPELKKQYNQLKFTEDVINGRSAIVTKDPKKSTETLIAEKRTKNAKNKTQLKQFLNKKR